MLTWGRRVWGQEQAFEESQKYKEGKFIIEKAKMTKVRHSQLLGRSFFHVRIRCASYADILSGGVIVRRLQEGSW